MDLSILLFSVRGSLSEVHSYGLHVYMSGSSEGYTYSPIHTFGGSSEVCTYSPIHMSGGSSEVYTYSPIHRVVTTVMRHAAHYNLLIDATLKQALRNCYTW